jgi:hypothetical protein
MSARVGSRRNAEHKKKTTQGTKKLGRVAQLSIYHNDDEAEKFIAALEAGRETRLQLGHVVRAYGGGSFSVKAGSATFDASLRGMLMGRGRFHHNPEAPTAARVGSYVVLDGAQIMAVLSPDQAARAKRVLGMRSGSRRSSTFNRSSEERRNAATRAKLLANLNLRRSSSKNRSSRRSWFSFF